jgi:hypothetical protein
MEKYVSIATVLAFGGGIIIAGWLAAMALGAPPLGFGQAIMHLLCFA